LADLHKRLTKWNWGLLHSLLADTCGTHYYFVGLFNHDSTIDASSLDIFLFGDCCSWISVGVAPVLDHSSDIGILVCWMM
jgi:hypothetical protein